MLLTQKAYAERKGVSPQYINTLVRSGKILLIGRRVDSRQADAALLAHRRAGRLVKTSRSTRRTGTRTSQTGSHPPSSALALSETRSLTRERIRREAAQAGLAELAYKQAQGALLSAAEVMEAERRKNENLRAALRRLPRIVAPVVYHASSPADVERILLTEIDRLLRQLARDPLGMREVLETSVDSETRSSTPNPAAPSVPMSLIPKGDSVTDCLRDAVIS